MYKIIKAFCSIESGRNRIAAPLPLAPVFNPGLVSAQVTPSRTTALVTTPTTSRRPLVTTTATAVRRFQTTSKPFGIFKPLRNASEAENLLFCDFEVTSDATDNGCGVR